MRSKLISYLLFGISSILVVALLMEAITTGMGGMAAAATTDEDVYTVVIETTKGVITIELYGDKMPVTTANFVRLVDEGFYDGLLFHRVMDDFMIQGGLQYPDGTLKQSPYGPIPLETHPDVTHVDGAISMARTTDPNSATSQFFICDEAQPMLDGSYAAFGRVIEGMTVVREIASVSHDGSLDPSPGGGKPRKDVILKWAYTISAPTEGRPFVNITFPAQKATVSALIIVEGTTTQSEFQVQNVQLKIDDQDWIFANGTIAWNFSWNTLQVSNGDHILRVRADDGRRYSPTQAIILRVHNQKEGSDGIPGFELTMLIGVIIAVFLLRKRINIHS
jgi:cyclophilin family peptidyl-prolyl cis-trans isomerase